MPANHALCRANFGVLTIALGNVQRRAVVAVHSRPLRCLHAFVRPHVVQKGCKAVRRAGQWGAASTPTPTRWDATTPSSRVFALLRSNETSRLCSPARSSVLPEIGCRNHAMCHRTRMTNSARSTEPNCSAPFDQYRGDIMQHPTVVALTVRPVVRRSDP